MKKLSFSLLFFSAIAWLWIGHMIAADGLLNNVSGTTTVGGAPITGTGVTNGNVNGIVLFTNNGISVSFNNINGSFIFTNANVNAFGMTWRTNGQLSTYSAIDAVNGVTSGGNIQAVNASVLVTGSGRAVSSASGPVTAGTIVVGTNGVLTTGQVNTTAGTANNWTSNNIYCGRVRISSGSQSYFLTNTAVTTSSIVLAAVNTADATAFSCQAIPTSGLLQLKLNGVAAGDCDISWRIVSP